MILLITAVVQPILHWPGRKGEVRQRGMSERREIVTELIGCLWILLSIRDEGEE